MKSISLIDHTILCGGGLILHKPDELPPDSRLFQACNVWSKITGKGPVDMIKLVLIK